MQSVIWIVHETHELRRFCGRTTEISTVLRKQPTLGAAGVGTGGRSVQQGGIGEVCDDLVARIAGVESTHGRPVAVGEPANIAVWNLTEVWSVSRDGLASKSRNTPYHGMELRGRNRHTVFNGNVVVKEGVAQR